MQGRGSSGDPSRAATTELQCTGQGEKAQTRRVRLNDALSKISLQARRQDVICWNFSGIRISPSFKKVAPSSNSIAERIQRQSTHYLVFLCR